MFKGTSQNIQRGLSKTPKLTKAELLRRESMPDRKRKKKNGNLDAATAEAVAARLEKNRVKAERVKKANAPEWAEEQKLKIKARLASRMIGVVVLKKKP